PLPLRRGRAERRAGRGRARGGLRVAGRRRAAPACDVGAARPAASGDGRARGARAVSGHGAVAESARPQPGGGLRQLVGASRPISWVNTAYPFAAAYLVGGGRLDAVLLVGTLYFLVPYNLLMYGVNDVFDYESDLRNPRKGGVE